jgi:hypothetical protein
MHLGSDCRVGNDGQVVWSTLCGVLSYECPSKKLPTVHMWGADGVGSCMLPYGIFTRNNQDYLQFSGYSTRITVLHWIRYRITELVLIKI